MVWWSASHDLLACVGTIGPVHSGVPCTNNITFHSWFCFPLPLLYLTASSLGGPRYMLALPWLFTWRVYQIISLNFPLDFGPLQLDIIYDHTWYPCWTTSMNWRVYYTSLGTWYSPAMLWTPCPPPNLSSVYPYSPWRVGIMRWSRGWISASKFLNMLPQ